MEDSALLGNALPCGKAAPNRGHLGCQGRGKGRNLLLKSAELFQVKISPSCSMPKIKGEETAFLSWNVLPNPYVEKSRSTANKHSKKRVSVATNYVVGEAARHLERGGKNTTEGRRKR